MTKQIRVRRRNHSHAEVDADRSVLQELSDHFSFYVEGYQFQPKFKYGSWSGKIHLFKIQSRLLPLGLAGRELDQFADMNGFDVVREDESEPAVCDWSYEGISEWVRGIPVYSGGDRITPHDEQVDSVALALTEQRAILNLPTSSGKSLIQALIARWLSEYRQGTTLIIVPSVNLVSQMQADLVDYRLFTENQIQGISGGASKVIQEGTKVVVGTWQTLSKMDKTWFNGFMSVLCDEAHLATGPNISKLIEQRLTHCPIKIGLTGTVKKARANKMQLKGQFGPIHKPTSTSRLIEQGKISPLNIKMLCLKYGTEESKSVRRLKYKQEMDWLCEHRKRNEIISRLAVKHAVDQGENVMVLYNFTAHGENIMEKIRELYGPGADKRVHMISGKMGKEKREKLRQAAEKTTGMILVSSVAIMGTGVSIKNLHCAIFAHPSKSEVRTLQSLGRTLRKHKDKESATLIDIMDDTTAKQRGNKTKLESANYSYKHGAERLKMYAEESLQVNRHVIQMS